MKKIVTILLISLFATTTASGCDSNKKSSPSTSVTTTASEFDLSPWPSDLKELMQEELGLMLPYIELPHLAYGFDQLYKEVVVKDTGNVDYSNDYYTIVENSPFTLDIYSGYYIRDNVYLTFYFDPYLGEFTILAGTIPVALEDWDDEVKAIMNQHFGVTIPTVFSDKVSYYYNAEEGIFYLYDEFANTIDYEYYLFDAGFIYLDSDFVYDYFYIPTPKYNDKVVLIGVAYSEIKIGLYTIPGRSTAWNATLVSAIDFFFDTELPFVALSTFYGTSLDPLADEIVIVDPFTGDINSTYQTILYSHGFTSNGVADSEGLIRFVKDNCYIRIGFVTGFGYVICIGSVVAPPAISAWRPETVTAFTNKWGTADLPVAPVTETYEMGTSIDKDYIYITDFRSGDIFDEYASILVDQHGYTYIREESDGFHRFDGNGFSIYILYAADSDTFQIFIRRTPAQITEWNEHLKEVMMFRLGAIIPVAPVYSDARSDFNASLGIVFIMDLNGIDVSAEYDLILRAAGYLPLSEHDLSAGYYNPITDITIRYAYYGAAGGFEIIAELGSGYRSPIDSWDPTLQATITDSLDSEIPVVPITNYYFAFAEYDNSSGTPVPNLVRIFDTYCPDMNGVVNSYIDYLKNHSGYNQIAKAQALSLLNNKFYVDHAMLKISTNTYYYFYDGNTLLVFGIDTGADWEMGPLFVLCAYDTSYVPAS